MKEMTERRHISFDAIKGDPDIQQRVKGIDKEVVGAYAEAMREGEVFPPPIVFGNDSDGYLLADASRDRRALVQLPNWPTAARIAAHSTDRDNGCSSVELTLVKKANGPCTKQISLVENRVISDGSACAIWDGTAKRLPIEPFQGRSAAQVLALFLSRVEEDKAICLGRLLPEVAERVPLGRVHK
jgi:hypothetical protein